jgi:hypothetical protein
VSQMTLLFREGRLAFAASLSESQLLPENEARSSGAVGITPSSTGKVDSSMARLGSVNRDPAARHLLEWQATTSSPGVNRRRQAGA